MPIQPPALGLANWAYLLVPTPLGPTTRLLMSLESKSDTSHSFKAKVHSLEAGQFVFNGAGTTAGLSLIEEFGRLETPILLTNTLSVGTVYEGVVRYMVERIFASQGAVPWFNPVVGETSDAYLNDIGGLHVRPEHVLEAIDNAQSGPVAEGCVGAGTGTAALGYKAGIGTASRSIQWGRERASVGVLVQANFGGRLRIDGIDFAQHRALEGRDQGASIMIVVATDLPLSSHLLNRVSKRAILGMARWFEWRSRQR